MAHHFRQTTGAGRYSWIDLEGVLHHGTHWDALPAEMDRLVAWVPDTLDPPHTDAEHAAMAGLGARLQEALDRCRR